MLGFMYFDFVVGNPPYQDVKVGTNNKQPSLYHNYYEVCFKLFDKVALITPARFLTRAGDAPKKWMESMLSDKYLQVKYYNVNSSEVFGNSVDIKGGVAVCCRDVSQEVKPIGYFTPFKELDSIRRKVVGDGLRESMSDIIYHDVKFSDLFFEENPWIGEVENKGVATNSFSKYDTIFTKEKKSDNDICFFGLINNKRCYRWVNEKYVIPHRCLDKFKVFVPKSNGNGVFGEKMSVPIIGIPKTLGGGVFGNTDLSLCRLF